MKADNGKPAFHALAVKREGNLFSFECVFVRRKVRAGRCRAFFIPEVGAKPDPVLIDWLGLRPGGALYRHKDKGKKLELDILGG